MGERTLTVEVMPGGVEPRLDAFLHQRLPALSRRLVRRVIAEGLVHVNGRPGAKGTRLLPGDRVTLPELAAGVVPEPELALPILYEDASLVAVDKPGGMPAHRLDPGTSGVLLAARTPAAHAAMRAALRARAVEKRYLALVAGAAPELDGR